MRVSEIRVNQIRVNQGLGVHKIEILLMRFLANATFCQVPKVALGKNPL